MNKSDWPLDEIAGRLAAVVDSADDAIVSKTLEGIITSWNASAERMFGYSAAEAVGQHITLIIPEERRWEEDEVLALIRKGERVEHFETERRRADGRRLDVSLSISPVRNSAGEVIGASKIARDITERRRLERERAALLLLEQRARREAERLNRTKDEFLAVLSHELRTPLNAILGWAHLLEAGQLDAQTARRATEAIVRNSMAQVRLIDDLLDVSRIITGNMRLELRPMDIRTVVEAAVDAVRPAANAKAIQLQMMVDPGHVVILGDPDRLRQVMLNVLTNAIKFTPTSGRVHLEVLKTDQQVEITVSDSGEGIAPEVLPYVFERFRQGHSGSNRRHGGLGIGLALVRHLVELHGGTVKADSPGVGLGASITIRLPTALTESPEEPGTGQVAALEGPDTAPQAALRGVHVLVVDDDVDGLEMAAVILVDAGADVKTATSVASAVAILDAWWPDVLVADIEMPDQDGFSLLRRARTLAMRRGRPLPALALTAYGGAEDRRRALAAGFGLYFRKPVDPAELSLAVATLTGRTALGESAAPVA